MNRLRLDLILFQLLIIASLLVSCKKEESVEIQYLANQGVLVRSSGTQILVDATFMKVFSYLDALPKQEIANMANADSSYSDIDLILATHAHGDHFGAEIVGNHLTNNPEAWYFGPNESIDSLHQKYEHYDEISSRLKSDSTQLHHRKKVHINGVEIDVLRFEHFGESPWKEAESFTYLISIGGKKIAHFGDARIDSVNIQNFNLMNEDIDVAIIPYWQMSPSAEQKEVIENLIKPKLILAGHIPPGSREKAIVNVEKMGYENVELLTAQMKKYVIGKDALKPISINQH